MTLRELLAIVTLAIVTLALLTFPPNAVGATGVDQVARGVEAARAGGYHEAVRLFTAALEASSGLTSEQRAIALNNRAMAWKNLGVLDQALSDLDRAVEMAPDRAKAYRDRGVAQFLRGRFRDAAADLTRFLERHPDIESPYPHLWRYLARERAGLAGRADLAVQVDRLVRVAWPGPLLRLHLDELSPETLLGYIGHHSRERQRDNACDAYFHIGEYHLLRGERAEAARWFDKALATGAVHLNEYQAARMERAAINGGRPPGGAIEPAAPVRGGEILAALPAMPTPSPLSRRWGAISERLLHGQGAEGYFLQIGSYREAESLTEVRHRLAPLGLALQEQSARSGTLFFTRLYVGPFADWRALLRVEERVTRRLGGEVRPVWQGRPWVAER